MNDTDEQKRLNEDRDGKSPVEEVGALPQRQAVGNGA